MCFGPTPVDRLLETVWVILWWKSSEYNHLCMGDRECFHYCVNLCIVWSVRAQDETEQIILQRLGHGKSVNIFVPPWWKWFVECFNGVVNGSYMQR